MPTPSDRGDSKLYWRVVSDFIQYHPVARATPVPDHDSQRGSKSRASSRARPAESGASRRSAGAEPDWVEYRDEQLLDMRMCDLGLRIEGTMLEGRIQRLYNELQRHGLRLKPPCWLSEEWFSPDGVPGIAIPFYLAHPRLMRLEARQMHHVEGGTLSWCMRILRHEAGHVIDTAFRLHRRARWRELFGSSTKPYPDTYLALPASRNFVLHLDNWYGQSHPAEDFAETFAVWMTPGARWRTHYADWPALAKLEYVDELMEEIAGQRPAVTTRGTIEPLRELRKTLGEHYAAKRDRYASEHDHLDRALRRMFPAQVNGDAGESAAAFLRRLRRSLRGQAADWSLEYQYTFDQTLRELIARAQRLRLRRIGPVRPTRQAALKFLAARTRLDLKGGRHRLAL